MASQRKVAKAIAQLADPDRTVRQAAARRLGRHGATEATDALSQALKDRSWNVRCAAAGALGRIGSDGATESLMLVLCDRYANVRRAAVTALGKIGDPRAVAPLCSALEDAKRSVCESATDALLKIGAPSIAMLCRTLVLPDSESIPNAVPALRALHHRAGTPLLRCILSDPGLTPSQRHAGLEALRGPRANLLFDFTSIRDVHRFCQKMADAEREAEAVRHGARAVLEYLTLARASERDPATEKEILLRAAHGTASTDSADILLRASGASGETDSPSLLDRIMRLFQRD